MFRVLVRLTCFAGLNLLGAANAGDGKLDAGTIELFNGKDLTGWGYKSGEKFDGKTESDDKRFTAKDRMIVVNPGKGIKQLWTTKAFPNDFELRLEFRAAVNADSGLFLRGPQLQVRDYLVAGPYKNLKKYKAQDWNEIVVVVKGTVAHCTCNGEILENALKLPATGGIGLEADRGQMEYRNIRLKAGQGAPPAVPAIRDRLGKYIAAKEIAGAVTLVATPDRIVHLDASGNAVLNGEAMHTDAIFWIASMSKPILGTLLLMLQDEGLLNVEDPVEKYLPEFKNLKTADGKPVQVTIRHLLTHTSGMGEINAEQARACKTLADVIPLYVAKPVAFTPGSRWMYCQSGINTGGRIAEVVTKEPLDKLLQRRLFDPLGMKDTTFYLTEKQLPRLAKTYKRTPNGELEAVAIGFLNGKSPTSRDRFPAPNGGLFSTASDYARFCQMILRGGELDGKRYLKADTVKQMTTIETADLRTGFTPGNGWGFAWCVIREPQGITAMLSPGAFGHGGAYGTQAWIDPETKRVYILMVQRANFPNSDASEVRRGFQEAATAAFGQSKSK